MLARAAVKKEDHTTHVGASNGGRQTQLSLQRPIRLDRPEGDGHVKKLIKVGARLGFNAT